MVSGFQIQSVIRAYMENMKLRVKADEKAMDVNMPEDVVIVSGASIKATLFEKAQQSLAGRVAKSELQRLDSNQKGKKS